MFLNKVIPRASRFVQKSNGLRFMSEDSTVEVSKIEKTVNQVSLLGRTGGPPQKRGSEQHPVVIFSLATHTNYKYETGQVMQRTDWHRVCVFKPGLRDSVYNYMQKGQRVMVNGRLTYGEIKDENGNPKSTTSIVADDVIFFNV